MQYVCASGQAAIMCKSHAIHQALIMSYMSRVAWHEGTAQPLSLTEFKSHSFYWLKPLNDEEEEETGVPRENP